MLGVVTLLRGVSGFLYCIAKFLSVVASFSEEKLGDPRVPEEFVLVLVLQVLGFRQLAFLAIFLIVVLRTDVGTLGDIIDSLSYFGVLLSR